MIRPKPVVLCILDGWGIAPKGPGNAISLAHTPNMDKFWGIYTHTQLIADGESVGLPKREPGNTETGHLNIGAGRIVYQDQPRINMSIADGSFFQNPALIGAIEHTKKNNSNLHLLGLIGGGGVHSDLSHLFAILRLCNELKFNRVFMHVFTDGRDSPPTAAKEYINQIKKVLDREKLGIFASVMGRYYAMDRDFRWDRTEKAYVCLTKGVGNSAPTIDEAVSQSYLKGVTDEFIVPTVIANSPRITDNDAVIFLNFRIDRPRQLTKAFVETDFEQVANETGFDPYTIKYLKKHIDEISKENHPQPFVRESVLKNLYFVTMTEYEKNLPVQIAFPAQLVTNPLGEVLSQNGLSQLRVAESEKERFVTYYFNGQREKAFTAERRLIVPSPKVTTYDLRPEMSARNLTERVVSEIHSGIYDVIIINFANADMVGHTGNIPKTIIGCETVDFCLGELASSVIDGSGGVLIITADHGNAEEMINYSTGEVDTEHNSNPVPFIIVGRDYENQKQLPQGILADVAPTMLHVLNIPIPSNITGRNLLE